MTVFVVAHGAWSAGWAWKKMHPLMAKAGHRLFTPTYTGLGERGHLAHPAIDLDAHIADVVGVLTMEDLRDVALIGHSYGGMVATGIADRARDRIARLIYLDAFAPQDGESLFALGGATHEQMMRDRAVEGWRVSPNPMPPDTPEADKMWAVPRRLPQPIKTFAQPLRLSAPLTLPRHYIYATRAAPNDVFRQFLERAKREGWGVSEIDASHNPHITCPEVLMALLEGIVGNKR